MELESWMELKFASAQLVDYGVCPVVDASSWNIPVTGVVPPPSSAGSGDVVQTTRFSMKIMQ